MRSRDLLLDMYDTMLKALGPSGWWPGESPFEIAVGAILTQNTNWQNAAKAIANLKEAGPMTPAFLLSLDGEMLAEHIRPAGYFRLKAGRLGNFLKCIRSEAGDDADLESPELEFLSGRSDHSLRETLLSVKGIGPETADSILLYALNRPEFVVDAYTARIMQRHGLAPEDVSYEELKDLFTCALPEDPALYNEYHALLVRVGKTWCTKSKPRCGECPLGPFLD